MRLCTLVVLDFNASPLLACFRTRVACVIDVLFGAMEYPELVEPLDAD
jgi:hypothetical protein